MPVSWSVWVLGTSSGRARDKLPLASTVQWQKNSDAIKCVSLDIRTSTRAKTPNENTPWLGQNPSKYYDVVSDVVVYLEPE